ncbi:MAG TPA: permease-like cell division protein FtsX [Candidatus Dormibacteraeota bacterium]|nr:permease-like cell division protein FtsX [Candidatus Dormibacteraeota bacterium]
MAGIVFLKGNFPRRRMAQIVGTNIVRYVFGGAGRSWLRNLSSTAPALGSMTLLLLLSGLVGLAGYALNNLERVEAGQASLLYVYLRDDATAAEVDDLWTRLANDPRVANVTYTSKLNALKRAQSIPGLPQLAGSSDSNPFPASLNVQMKSIKDVAGVDSLVRSDVAVDPSYPTSYDQGSYQRIQSVLFGLAVAGIVFLGLLGFVAVTVTVNSIRAAIHARRDEIRIMQLVGAPRWMVRGPFVVEGAITGALSGAAAGLVTFGLVAAGIHAGSASFTQFAPGVTVLVAAAGAAMVFAAGLGLGSASSLLSLRRHMES